MTINETFEFWEKYLEEHYDEVLAILKDKICFDDLVEYDDAKKYGKDTITFEFIKFPETPIELDEDKHMWYNTFNKWSWANFENGVVKIEDN